MRRFKSSWKACTGKRVPAIHRILRRCCAWRYCCRATSARPMRRRLELAVMDLRWQMALDCLGAEEPPFSQGALQAFRERMVEHGMDRALLDRTVALVREGAVGAAEGKSLSKALRVAVDSRPL